MPTPAPASPDRNCSDFDTWEDAQAFYEAAGGPGADPHGLDRDRNGIACESLPGAPGSATPTPESKAPTPTPGTANTVYDPDGPDRNCSDFDTWEDAQAFYEAEGGPETDRHRLDHDGDGVACESLPRAPGSATPTPESKAPTPTPGTANTVYDPDGPDRNCSDFDTWEDAQAFYEAGGGPETDRHRLDHDGDGVACESLPRAS